MRRQFLVCSILLTVVVCATAQLLASGIANSYRRGALCPRPIPPVANPCSRPAAGSVVRNPPALVSRRGVLSVNFSYQTTSDADGRTLFCFMTPKGIENPTLHVHPGDHLIINVTNNTPATPPILEVNPPNCSAAMQTGSSLNLHFHGTNTSPSCHQDNVTRTLINSGRTFVYDLHFPADEPPGLYWYHTHVHMLVEPALQGGASGAIVVEGLQDLQPAVAGLEQRILLIRDQIVAGNPEPGADIPSWDLTVNNVPIAYPQEIPAVIQMRPGERQLWRISNSSADSILDLQVQFDGVPQTVQIVALDGVPTGSQDGSRRGKIIKAKQVLIPTAGRAEFIVTPPSSKVSKARLVTLAINTGPDGDNDPKRVLAKIGTVSTPPPSLSNSKPSLEATNDRLLPSVIGSAWKQRFENLASAKVITKRSLYFSEDNPASQFFITEDGATPVLFDPNNPPAIVTTQGSVEDWTIENRSLENHEFHIHQIHFLVMAQKNFEPNGSQADPSIQQQFLDTIQIPFWDGKPKHPFPSVTVRLDFRGADIGDFVYHCHIAEHEDDGMMAIIRVEPTATAAALERTRLYFASLGESLGLLPAPDAAATQRVYAWCRARRSVWSRTARINAPETRFLARAN